MKVKLNYFFFIITIIIPLVVAPIGIIILWPLVFNPYQILGVYGSIIVAYLWMFIFTWGIAAYMAIPWLIMIRDNKIIFYRLFRKKLVIPYRDIKKIEVLTNKVPVSDFLWSIANIIFYRADDMKLYGVGVPHYAIIYMYKVFEKQGIIFEESTRKPSKEEVEGLIIK